MLFSSTVFLFLFLPILIIVYNLKFFSSISKKNVILLIFSLFFYAWGEPVFVFFLAFSIIINWILGKKIETSEKKTRKVWLITAITYDVGLLGYFKYASFLSKNISFLMNNSRIVLNIALPIGISFFTFQLMSYIFDIYYRKAKSQEKLLDFALYISLFPQLVAGPIVRYNQIKEEIIDRHVNRKDFYEGIERFIYGLAKKMLLANNLGYIADAVFNLPSRAFTTAWLGAICYSLQIYFDFSGYSDMAIGLGRLFGFHFDENFNYPYIAYSITDFWKRWHISLTSWFRDYIYIPLGGNRVSIRRWVFNCLIVWLLTGIWHGANWTFLLWGGIYFLVMIVEKWLTSKNKSDSIFFCAFSHLYTLIIVIMCWVLFRASGIGEAITFWGNMYDFKDFNAFKDPLFVELLNKGKLIISISVVLTMPVYRRIRERLSQINYKLETIIRSVLILVLFSLSIIETVTATYNPFIYFNF